MPIEDAHRPSRAPGQSSQPILSGEGWVALAEACGLTQRELEIAALLVEGNNRREIARRLKCSVAAVRKHLRGLFTKFEVEDKVNLVLRIVRVHLDLQSENR